MESEYAVMEAERDARESLRVLRGGTSWDHTYDPGSRSRRCDVRHDAPDGLDWKSVTCGKGASAPEHRMWRVNVYELSQVYGGPEEGGWWYEAGEPRLTVELGPDRYHDAIMVRDALETAYPIGHNRFSVAPRGEDYEVRVERCRPQAWPRERQRYE